MQDTFDSKDQDLASYATESFAPLLLLVPYDSQHPVCESLWNHVKKANQNQPVLNQFILELINPCSERTQTITIRCVSGGILDSDWDTTYELKSLENSGHPCNTPRPPCLGKPAENPEVSSDTNQPYTPPTLWERLHFWRRSDNHHHLTHNNQEPFPEDTEIKPLTLLRSSLLVSPDCRAYRVIIQTHSRRDASGKEILFLVTLSFGRCGRGENTLSIRCQYEDRDGLVIDIR